MRYLGILSPQLTSTQGPQIILCAGLVPAGGGGRSQGLQPSVVSSPQGLSCLTLTLWSVGLAASHPGLPVSPNAPPYHLATPCKMPPMSVMPQLHYYYFLLCLA